MTDIDGRDEMMRELQQLRRGHGVHAADLMSRVGPRLASVCGIDRAMPSGERRRLLVQHLTVVVAELPDDLRLSVQAAFALPPASQSRFLRERMQWLGERFRRDPRTAMRRAESGLALLAERLTSLPGHAPVGEVEYAEEGWYVDNMRTTLMLHVDPVQVLETRRVISLVAGLARLRVSWSVPADAPADGAQLGVETLYGGQLRRDDAASTAALWTGYLELPRPLSPGEQHEYQVRVSLLPRRDMRPYYVLSPLRRVDVFELRAKFDTVDPPEAIWRLDGVPFQLLDEKQPVGRMLQPDAAGEVVSRFRSLRGGLSYGLRWRDAPPLRLHPPPR